MTLSKPCFMMAAALLLGLSAAPAMADDTGVSASIGFGLTRLRADETVYDGGHRLSELEWRSKTTRVIHGTLDADIGSGWSVRFDGKTGFKGNSHMTDYDWVPPLGTSGPDSWSDRSLHDDTGLDHYFTGSAELNRRIYGDDSQKMSLGVGGRYTDVKWTAKGGSYIYSAGGFRNVIGNFIDGQTVIDYRQKIPVLYTTLGGEKTIDKWRFTGGLEAGAVIKARDVDNHVLRDLNFKESFAVSPMFGIKASVEYQVTPSVALYLDGSFEATKFRRGDTRMLDKGTGATAFTSDSAGGSFSAAYIGTGIRASF